MFIILFVLSPRFSDILTLPRALAHTHTQTLARKARDAFLIIKISNIKPIFNFFKSQITQALEDER